MGPGTGSRPWRWVRVWVRDHRYGYGYGYGTMGMGTMGMGMGTGQGCQVADERLDSGYNYSYATLFMYLDTKSDLGFC